MPELSDELASRVQTAFQDGTPLNIVGAGTKAFLGQQAHNCIPLDITGHHGIIEYDPAELVMVARAGTPLLEIQKVLASHKQMLGFEPPFVNHGATLGGAVASGLAGPRRAYSGAVRDFILGVSFINGRGEIITSGGKVMKNVAGFDLFRPMARSMGTLGVLLKIALRVIPQPDREETLVQEECNELDALKKMSLWAGKTQAISAASWDGQSIYIRLSGSTASIADGRSQIGGQILDDENWWQALNDFRLKFFQKTGRLWRFSIAPMSGPASNGLPQLIDWGGAQRWVKSDEPPETVRSRARGLDGHAECFSDDQDIITYHPLTQNDLALHQRFKASLDPAGILNPGRLYPEL